MRELTLHQVECVSGGIGLDPITVGAFGAGTFLGFVGTIGDFLGRLAGQTVVIIRDGQLPRGVAPVGSVPRSGGGVNLSEDDS